VHWHAFYPPGLPGFAEYPAIPLWEFVRPSAKTAIIDGDESVTYRELRTRIERAAGWFRKNGVRPDERVLLRLPNSIAFVVAYYGALRAGGIVSAAGPELGASAWNHQRSDVDPLLVVEGDVGAADPPDPDPYDIAVLQYTSGTTGRSKGAVMSHANLVANALQNARWFGWTRDEVNLCALPLFHTWGMSVCLNSTMAVGGTLVLLPRFDPEETLAAIERYDATVLYGSATMFHRLLDVAPRAVPTLRHVKAGAMLTQGSLKERWDERYPHAPLQQGYGLTEASPESHNNPPHRFKRGTVGIPLQDTDCRIVDGEIWLRGPQVCRGYWRGETFEDGWLRTGDIGEMDEDGYLTIVDRKKDILKFRGYTVSPNAVEDCLLAHPAVREAVVVGRPDDRDGDVPVAFIVAAAVEDEKLFEHCRARLARYEVPREIRRVEAIPKNAVGKPLRRELRTLVG
jgi:long-chain acyl-CoA synthetase